MKYEFIKKSLDDYVLKYTDKNGIEKEIPFKRTINIAADMQRVTATARMKMIAEMSKNGYKREDFITKNDDGKGHITYDESQLKYIEQGYIEQEQGQMIFNIFEKTFGMDLPSLLTEMGMDINSTNPEDIQAVSLFTQKFAMLSTNEDNTPSESDKQ